jgi:hypothetical protein
MSRSNHKFGGKFGADPAGDPFAGQDPFASVPNVDERLADWVDGTMSSRDRERFEAEMRVSPHLREQVADYEATVASIREALNDETHETNLADRVMASLAQEASKPAPRRRSGWPFVWAVMSAAALLGIAILIDSWGGTMLVPKTETDAVARLIDPAIGGLENQTTENDSLDRSLEAGTPTSAKTEPGFELVENEFQSSNPARQRPAAKQNGELQELNEVAGFEKVAPSVSPESRLATGLSLTGGVETPRAADTRPEAKDKAVARKVAVPLAGAPVSGTSAVRTVPKQSKPTAAGPTSAGRSGPGRSGAGPSGVGPSGAGPSGPGLSVPGSTGGGSTAGLFRGPTTGGPATGEPGVVGRGGRSSGRARNPSAKPRSGATSVVTERPASPTVTTLEKFAKRKSVPPQESLAPDSEVSRGRPLAEQRSRTFLMRLSEAKSDGELLPLVTLEGLAIAFELPEQDKQQSVAGEPRGVRPSAQTGSDDFYLGSTRRGQRQILRGFFDRQMQPAPEWRETLRQADEKGAASRRQLEPKVVSIGGLQLFAVGPVDHADEAAEVSSAEVSSAGANRAGAAKQDPNVVHETKSKSLLDVAKTGTPGEWDANGGAVVQRDWLVVGPKSEVAKLLVALRRYSGDANSRKFLTAEVRLVKPDLQREGRAKAQRTSDGSDPAKNGPATKPKPADTASPLPAARGEPTQRVVIRFRVRR